jgi:hypothetical protein
MLLGPINVHTIDLNGTEKGLPTMRIAIIALGGCGDVETTLLWAKD